MTSQDGRIGSPQSLRNNHDNHAQIKMSLQGRAPGSSWKALTHSSGVQGKSSLEKAGPYPGSRPIPGQQTHTRAADPLTVDLAIDLDRQLSEIPKIKHEQNKMFNKEIGTIFKRTKQKSWNLMNTKSIITKLKVRDNFKGRNQSSKRPNQQIQKHVI